MPKIKKGDRVQVHFTGRLPDGQVFESSEGRTPLEFEAGAENVIPGVSQAVIGMEEGQEKTVTVAPEDGFGPRHPQLIQEVPRSSLPDDAKPGDKLQAQAGEDVIPVWVKELKPESAVVDANHPLAGTVLEFDLKIIAIQPAS